MARGMAESLEGELLEKNSHMAMQGTRISHVN